MRCFVSRRWNLGGEIIERGDGVCGTRAEMEGGVGVRSDGEGGGEWGD
jgi:hypothetical protein